MRKARELHANAQTQATDVLMNDADTVQAKVSWENFRDVCDFSLPESA